MKILYQFQLKEFPFFYTISFHQKISPQGRLPSATFFMEFCFEHIKNKTKKKHLKRVCFLFKPNNTCKLEMQIKK